MAVHVTAVAAPCLTGAIGGLAYTTSKHAVVGIPGRSPRSVPR